MKFKRGDIVIYCGNRYMILDTGILDTGTGTGTGTPGLYLVCECESDRAAPKFIAVEDIDKYGEAV